MPAYYDPRSKHWGFRVTYVDENGKKHRKYTSLGKGATKKDAERAEREFTAAARDRRFDLLKQARLGAEKPVPAVPFKDFAAKFFDEWTAVRCRASTQRSVEGILRVHLVPHFGDRDLRAIGVREVDAYVARARALVSTQSVKHHLVVLGKLFACAVSWGFASDNPVRRATPVKVAEVDFHYLDQPTSARFLAAARRVAPDHFAFLLTALRAGLRMGELLGLTWGQVDFGRGMIRVSQARIRGVEGPPKSGRIREVPMASDLRATLAALPRRGRYVFCDEDGEPLTPDSVKHPFRRARDAAGVDPALSPHDLRHSFASQLVATGTPLPAVQQLLGHSDIKVTMRYAHLAPSVQREGIERLAYAEAVDLTVIEGGAGAR